MHRQKTINLWIKQKLSFLLLFVSFKKLKCRYFRLRYNYVFKQSLNIVYMRTTDSFSCELVSYIRISVLYLS